MKWKNGLEGFISGRERIRAWFRLTRCWRGFKGSVNGLCTRRRSEWLDGANVVSTNSAPCVARKFVLKLVSYLSESFPTEIVIESNISRGTQST